MRRSLNRTLTCARMVCGWSCVGPAALALLACGASNEVVAPSRGADTALASRTSAQPAAMAPLLEKTSTATTREAALGQLSPELAAFLVGSAWAPLLEHATLSGSNWSTWLLDNQVLHQDPTSGRYTATLTGAQAERALNEFASTSLASEPLIVPSEWQTTFMPALLAEREWMVCQRRQELVAVTCQRPAPLNERLAVSALISDLSLEALLPDGIPVRESGAVVWPLDVRVVSQSKGNALVVAGIPLTLGPVLDDVRTTAAETVTPNDTVSPRAPAISDARGWARFELPPFTDALQVNVANHALLGPFAELTELPHLRVHTRSLDGARQVVVALDASSRPNGIALALVRELSLVYGKPLPSLPDELTSGIQQSATLGQSGAVLPEEPRARIVESTRGAVDYVVLVAGETEFASQMGADRTWYQARAQAHVVEVWSGKLVAQFDESATGSGFGDQAAEQAAKNAVVQRLRIRLQGMRTSQ